MSADPVPVDSVIEEVHTSIDFWVNSPEFLIWLDRARSEVGPVPNDYGGETECTAQLAVQRALDAAVGVLGLVPPPPVDPPPSSSISVLDSSATTPTVPAVPGRVAEGGPDDTTPTRTVGTAASTTTSLTSADPQADSHSSRRTSPSVSSPQIHDHNKVMSPPPHARLGTMRESPTEPTASGPPPELGPRLGTTYAVQEAERDDSAAVVASPACVTCALGVCRRESHRGRPGWIDVTKLPRSLVTPPVETTRALRSRSPSRVDAGSPRHTDESPTHERERLYLKQRLLKHTDSSLLRKPRSRPSLSERHRDGDRSPNSTSTQVAPPSNKTEPSLHMLYAKRRARSPPPVLEAASDSMRISSKRRSLSPSAAPLLPAERAQPTAPHDAGDGTLSPCFEDRPNPQFFSRMSKS